MAGRGVDGSVLAVVATPLALAAAETRPGDGLVTNLSIALGFVALSVLGLQFVITPRSTRLTVPFGVEAVVKHHRELTVLALVAVYGHPALLLFQDHTLLNVLHGPLRLQLAWGSVAAFTLLVLASLCRRVLHLGYGAWQFTHTLLAVTAVVAGAAHAYLIDGYTAWLPLRLAWGGYALVFVWLALWVRLVKPMRLWQRPWRVVELWPEPGQSVTVSLEPAHRHGGQRFRFQAGQFAWLFTRPRSLPQDCHPFSMSSSATRGRLEFTIKDSGGDFTGAVRRLRVGDEVYLDGPHGTFTMERHPGTGVRVPGDGGRDHALPVHARHHGRPPRRPAHLALPGQPEREPDHRHPPAWSPGGTPQPHHGARHQPVRTGLGRGTGSDRHPAARPLPARELPRTALLRLLSRRRRPVSPPDPAPGHGSPGEPDPHRAVRAGLTVRLMRPSLLTLVIVLVLCLVWAFSQH
jgi:hypothetical protein